MGDANNRLSQDLILVETPRLNFCALKNEKLKPKYPEPKTTMHQSLQMQMDQKIQ